MTPPLYSWVCPGCGRHVPARVPVCHCGVRREQQPLREGSPAAPAPAPFVAAPGWRGIWRSMPGDVRAMVALAALALVGGLATVVLGPGAPRGGAALLGYVERPAAAMTPVDRPAFKLPWWK